MPRSNPLDRTLAHSRDRLDAVTEELRDARAGMDATRALLAAVRRAEGDASLIHRTTAEAARRIAGAFTGWTSTFDGTLIRHCALDGGDARMEAFMRDEYSTPPGRHGANPRAVATGETVHIDHVRDDPEYRLGDLADRFGYCTTIAVPVLLDGRILGTIAVTGTKPGMFTARHCRSLRDLAGDAALAIASAQRFLALSRPVDLAQDRDPGWGARTDAAAAPAIRVQALGRLHVADREGRGIDLSGRQRPVRLLHALLAAGARHVRAGALTETLWPDAEGDGAQGLFEVNLHRLRRLLGVPGALTLQAGRLSLDDTLCDTDLWRFEALCRRIETSGCGTLPGVRAEGLVAELFALYGGPFLEGEVDPAWLLATRQTLAARFARAVDTLGTALRGRGQWDAAIRLYARALDLDDRVEAFHRGLMTCLGARGEHGAVARAFERCRAVLTASLGVPPSPDTERIVRALRGRPDTPGAV